MPDFGLTEALESAMKAAKSAEVMRPGERALAGSAATAAPEAAAPVVPGASVPAMAPVKVSAPEAPPALPGGATQAPAVNPSEPPPDVPPAAAAGAVQQPDVPAPSAVAQATGDETPPVVDPTASQTPTAPPVPAPAPLAVSPANALPPAPKAPEAPVSDVQAQATRFVQANLPDFEGKLNLSHMPNVDTMTSPDGLKAGILQVADDNEGAITAARRGTVSDEQLVGLAQDMAVNTDVVKQVMEREFGTTLQRPEVMLAARMVEQNQVGNLIALAGKVTDGTASSAEQVEFEQRMQQYAAYRTQLSGAQAEWGRAGRGLQIPVGTDPAILDHIAQVIQQNNPDRMQVARAIQMAGTPSGVATIVNGGIWARSVKASGSLLHRIFINGILSGPTGFKILWNNTFNVVANTADLGAAGAYRGMANLAARIGRYPTPAEGAALDDMVANIHGTLSGFMDGLRVAGRVLKTGVSMDEAASRATEDSPGRDRTITGYLPELNGTVYGSVASLIDKGVDLPGRVISAVDDFTKTMGFRGWQTMMTMKEVRARLADGTLKPGDAEQFVLDKMQHPTDEEEQAAEAWAHRMTFQTPWVQGGAGEAFQGFLNKVPVLRFVFPFMRTATNILKQSLLERTPAALLSARLRAQMAAGGLEGDLAKSRIITGTLFTSSLAWMAAHDRITGAGPKDPKERAIWEADGHQPYSIKITNPLNGKSTWRSYQWFEPIATIAGATADTVDVMRYIHGDAEENTMLPHDAMAQEAAAHIVAAVIENLGNKSFMQGAAAFSEMYNDPARAFGMWSDQMGATMVPYSGATKEIRNFQDPYLRQAYTLIDKIKDDLPMIPAPNPVAMGYPAGTPRGAPTVGGSKTLPARLDIFGEPRLREGGDSIMGPLTPMPGSPVKNDVVSTELNYLMNTTHTVPIGLPSKRLALLGHGAGLQDGEGMELTPSEYNDYILQARKYPTFDNGTLNLHDKLEQFIESPIYDTLSPSDKSEMFKYYQTKADQAGRAALWNENPEFRERMQAWTTQMTRLKMNQ